MHRFSLLVASVMLLTACDTPLESRVIPAQISADARETHRKLQLDGADNFRDLGGYRSSDGRTVKWGLVYRADALSDLSDTDMAFLERLQIKQVVDFRTSFEKNEDPDRIPNTIRYVERPVDVEGTAVKELFEKISSGDLADFDARKTLIEANRGFVRGFTGVFGPYLRSLAEADNLPSVAHCTGGKDRAGFAAAVTLLALGVPEATVREDFLKSNIYTADKIEKYIWMIRLGSLFRTDPEQVRPLLGVEAAYIDAAFDTMKSEYGSIDNYLREGLGLSDALREKLRNNLLEG